MATFIRAESGNVMNATEFKYNTIYENNKPKEDIDPTGNGDNGYIYGEFVATKFRNASIKEQGIGDLMGGADNSRSNTPVGDITDAGEYSYNGGNIDNVPQYFTDENSEEELNRADAAFTINGNTVLALRNDTDEENSDGVHDEKL